MFKIKGIRFKATLAFLIVSFSVLIFSFATFLVVEYQNFKSNTITNIQNLAYNIVSSNAASIEVQALKSIQLDLYKTLPRYSEVEYVCLFDAKGNPISVYDRAVFLRNEANIDKIESLILDSKLDSQLVGIRIPVFRPMGEDFDWAKGELYIYVTVEKQSGQQLATLYVKRSLQDFYQRFKQLAVLALLIICVSSILAVVLSVSAQRVITRPILGLQVFAQKIIASNDFSLRIKDINRSDEIGDLMRAFDKLLEHTQLQNQSLYAAKVKAEELALAKQEFLATMSHEIRTPMNAVMGMATLLQDTELTAIQRKYVDIILSSTESLLVIINDILDFSKIESGSLAFELIPMCPQEQIQNIVESYRPKFQPKKLTVNLDIASDVPGWILTDPVRFNQVVINLFTNAIKFTEKGSITIGARLLATDGKSSLIRFFVKDTGIGIPKEKHEDVFKLFTQANSSTTRKYGGTGLGLSISKQLVEMQQGRIYLESEEGKGSEFGFEIWFKNSAAPQAAAQTPKIEHEKGGKILLSEDNEVNQLLVVTLLNQWGLEVDVAINGRQVIEKAKQGTYDLILMDVHMPEIDGYQATRILRNELGISTPVLAITASAMKGETERCMEAGMNDLIPKPFRKQELKDKIFSFLA